MKSLLTIFFVFILSLSASAQKYFIRGNVKDSSNNYPLSYANVRVLNSTLGTSANKEGKFELRLPAGKYKLAASYIGYLSDTLSVNLVKDISDINFNLSQTNINFPEIVVKPGENPALRIIRKAIIRKKERDKYLNSYEYDAYTKGIIETPNDLKAANSRVTFQLGGADTMKLKISGILENESKGYFERPDNYKDVITARKQSANFPPTVNVLTGGRILKNFSSDKINFFYHPIPGPLADNSLSYYFFYIRKTVSLNNKPVYDIYMTPDKPDYPGFVGDIYIADSTYNLVKVDLSINRAANTGGLLDSVRIFQQFSSFNDSIYMPVDYRLYVKANVLNLTKFAFELNSVFYDYKINPQINTDIFNKAVITVLPNADKKDSTYWENAITIPNTIAEQRAYTRIDSLSNLPHTFWDDFSLLSTKINFSKTFATSAPLGMYHFNRVEGNALDFGLFLNDADNYRLNSSLKFSYGFADKKYKTNFGVSYLLGDYRTYKLSFIAYNKLNVLFESSDNYNDFFSSVLALVSKYEFRDYYYDKGFEFNASGDVFPVLNLNAGITNNTYNSALKNTDFSFFSRKKKFSSNPAIYDTKITALNAGFNFDFRNYIEDGLFRRRITSNSSYFTFGGKIVFSNHSFLKSNLDFTKYEFNFNATINTFASAKLYFKLFGLYSTGSVPYQLLYSIPGNIDLTATDNSFRTLNVNEILGSRLFTVNINHDFSDELFKLLNIPYLKSSEIQLSTFLNIAYSDINSKSKIISPYPIKTFRHPFYEIGFEIGHVLIPMQLDFAWRLNYRGENNFRIGVNAIVL